MELFFRYNFYRDNDSAGDSSSFHKYRQYICGTANNASNTVSGSANNTSVQASTSENQNSTSDSADQSEADSKGNSVGAVETGDNTPILPFVIIGIAAAVIVAVLVYLKKKK